MKTAVVASHRKLIQPRFRSKSVFGVDTKASKALYKLFGSPKSVVYAYLAIEVILIAQVNFTCGIKTTTSAPQ